jgi:UDP-N-acetylmuramyl pentapeptide phosphotransferase/UDP-N-acetylglucosamine-1-phosphate transferase
LSSSLHAALIVAVAVVLASAALVAIVKFATALPHALPGPRSLHDRPTPRVGGLAIWAGSLPAALLDPPPLPGGAVLWLAAWSIFVAISAVDDWRGVSPVYRLGAHIAGAALVAVPLAAAFAGMRMVAMIIAVVLLLVWAANLYNFMDGSDGLAGAMTTCGFAAYGVASDGAGLSPTVFFALSAASLVFLSANLPPARLFMGDVGAVPIGFLAAGVGLAGHATQTWPLWFPLLVFLPFVADATLTLCKRLLRRERVWEAHKQHYHQRLHQLGAGHWGTLIFFAVLMIGTSTSALATLAIDPAIGWGVTAAWAISLCALFSGIDYHWRHRTASDQ